LIIGLTVDDQSRYHDRMKFWEDFNHCWLATLLRQKELTLAGRATNELPQAPQSIIARDVLELLGNQVVHLCDGLEQHGLVDYQMGVWEEEIIKGNVKTIMIAGDRANSSTALSECIEALGNDDEASADPGEVTRSRAVTGAAGDTTASGFDRPP
jgi:hypothetical protein